jgi:predicted transcriptional regulator
MQNGVVPGRDPKVSDEELLRAIATATAPVVTTTEIADRVGLEQQSVYERFKKFEERRWLARKKVGSRAVVWWLRHTGRQQLATGSEDGA